MKKCFVMILMVLSVFILFSCSGDIGETNIGDSNASACIRGHITLPDESDLKFSDISFEVAGVNGKHVVKADGSWEVSGLEEGKAYDIYFTSATQTRGLIETGEYGAKLKDAIAKHGDSLIDYIAELCLTWTVYGTATLNNVLPSEGLGHTGISVFIPGTSYVARTDRNGNYRLSGVPKGTGYTLAFMYDGYTAVESMPFNLELSGVGGKLEKELHSVELNREKSCIYGSVILEDYPEHQFANGRDNVYVRGVDGNSPIFPISQNGNYSISGLKKGEYSIVYNIFLEDGTSLIREKQVTFSGDGNMRADMIVAGQATSVSGSIVCGNATVSKAKVKLQSALHGYETESGENGVFLFDKVMPGEYAMEVSIEGYRPYYSNLKVMANDPVHDLVIPIYSISMYGDYAYSFVEGGVAIIDYVGVAHTISIPEDIEGQSVVEIYDDAFRNKREVVKVIIPETVKRIGERAFSGCSRLSDIEIPEYVSYVGSSAFRECLKLERIIVFALEQHVNESWNSDWLAGCSASVMYCISRPRNFTVSRGEYIDKIKLSWDIMKAEDHHYKWVIARWSNEEDKVFILDPRHNPIDPESLIEADKMVFYDDSNLEPYVDYMYSIHAYDVLDDGTILGGSSVGNFGYLLTPPGKLRSKEIINGDGAPYVRFEFDGAHRASDQYGHWTYVLYRSDVGEEPWVECARIPAIGDFCTFDYSLTSSDKDVYFDVMTFNGKSFSAKFSSFQNDSKPICITGPNVIGNMEASDNKIVVSTPDSNGLYPVSLSFRTANTPIAVNVRVWKNQPVDAESAGFEEMHYKNFTVLDDGLICIDDVGVTPVGTKYYYAVQCIDVFGRVGDWSNINAGYSAITNENLLKLAMPFAVVPWNYIDSTEFTEYPYPDKDINTKWKDSRVTKRIFDSGVASLGTELENSYFNEGNILYQAVAEGFSMNQYWKYKDFGEVPYLISNGTIMIHLDMNMNGNLTGCLNLTGMYFSKLDFGNVRLNYGKMTGPVKIEQGNGLPSGNINL